MFTQFKVSYLQLAGGDKLTITVLAVWGRIPGLLQHGMHAHFSTWGSWLVSKCCQLPHSLDFQVDSTVTRHRLQFNVNQNAKDSIKHRKTEMQYIQAGHEVTDSYKQFRLQTKSNNILTLKSDYLRHWAAVEECFYKSWTCWKHTSLRRPPTLSPWRLRPKCAGLNTLWHTFFFFLAASDGEHQCDSEMIWEEFTNLISSVSEDPGSSNFHLDVIFLLRIHFSTRRSEKNGCSPVSLLDGMKGKATARFQRE